MKKILIIIYILFATVPIVCSQNMSLALGFGPALYNAKSEKASAFFSDYDTTYANTLKTKFKTTLSASIGWHGVLSFALGKKGLYYSTITINKVISENKATFINNEQRRMRFQYNDLGVDLGSGFRVGKKVAVGLITGMCFRNSYIKNSFIYTDGTEKLYQ